MTLWQPGPCEPWTPTANWTCNLSDAALAVSGTALQVASEVLFGATLQRFGLCTVTIRPCRASCWGGGWPWDDGWWQWGSWPRPVFYGGVWMNLACGGCGQGCSCAVVEQASLPAPVYDIVQVKVDGAILAPAAYRVDDHRLLVRLDGGMWPICNNLNVGDDQPDTWSVTARYGEPVPVSGQAAVGELGNEIARALVCEDTCRLPANVQSLTRQGVTVTMPSEAVNSIAERLYLVGLFVKTYNPDGAHHLARVYDIDGPDWRLTNT